MMLHQNIVIPNFWGLAEPWWNSGFGGANGCTQFWVLKEVSGYPFRGCKNIWRCHMGGGGDC